MLYAINLAVGEFTSIDISLMSLMLAGFGEWTKSSSDAGVGNFEQDIR